MSGIYILQMEKANSFNHCIVDLEGLKYLWTINGNSMKYRLVILLLLVAGARTVYCQEVFHSENLVIEKLLSNTFVYKTYFQTAQWGKVYCNGLIYCRDGEAVVFDTPVNDSLSLVLINWIRQDLHAKLKAVVVNHFHEDCLGGLKTFHDNGAASYSGNLTRRYAQQDTNAKPEVPQHGFNKELVLNVGKGKVVNRYYGGGHTRDNIVSYIPSEKVLFGGCLIKELGAGKGNLADADVEAWPNTVRKVKSSFPDAKYVVPGHGQYGNTSLLDYTIKLFAEN